jgi:hypothetical protein
MIDLIGKGMYLWIINEDEDPQDTAKACKKAGLTHVAIKVADAGYAYNVEYNTNGGRPWGRDKVPPLVEALRSEGVSPWGWVFVYGNTPDSEAEIAIQRTKTLGTDGLIINAEGAYKGKHAAAKRYMSLIRADLAGKVPLALSSFRFPDIHHTFPWMAFLSKVDINMPQVYWMLSHNAGEQMQRCYEQFLNPKYPQVPIFPTGAAFSEQSWRPTVEEILDFMERAETLGCKGVNFWMYRQARHRFPEYWEAISEYDWPAEPEQGPVDPPDEPPQPVPNDALFMAECTAAAWLRIRSEPKYGDNTVDYLAGGETTAVYQVSGDWYRIDRGWVGKSYMEIIAPPVEPEPTLAERVKDLETRMTVVEGKIDAL